MGPAARARAGTRGAQRREVETLHIPRPGIACRSVPGLPPALPGWFGFFK